MPIRGYIIHNNFIVLSCEITFIFSGFNLNGRSPADYIRLEVAKLSSPREEKEGEKKKEKKRKEGERRDKCMQRRRQKGQRHGGLKGKHVCDAYRRRVFFHKACNNGGRRQLAEIHDSRISPSRSPRVLLRLRWFRRSPFINKHVISFSKIFSFQRKIFLSFFPPIVLENFFQFRYTLYMYISALYLIVSIFSYVTLRDR